MSENILQTCFILNIGLQFLKIEKMPRILKKNSEYFCWLRPVSRLIFQQGLLRTVKIKQA
jgi:hypothetical protein